VETPGRPVQPRRPALNALVALIARKDASHGLWATRAYQAGEVVLEFAEVEWRSQRDRDMVEHPSGAHMFHPALAKVAHGCNPNCEISATQRLLIAVRPISVGEPISFDYETTETWFAHPFWCGCGARRCRGRIG
jgi:hypothetical protein